MEDLAVKFSPLVDETFVEESKSSLVVNNDYEFTGAKTIKIYSVSTAEMNDYGRGESGMSRYGTVSDLVADADEYVMEKDRSFTFSIDKMDEDETLGALNAGTALARQINEVVIPEVDEYVYGKMITEAGHTDVAVITKNNAYDELTEANEVLDEAKVPAQNRVCICTPAFYKNLKQCKDAVLDTEIGQDIKIKGVIADLDGVKIQKVTSSLIGSTTNFILAHPVATTFAVKLAEYKVFDNVPGISGSLVEGRLYYTAFVRKNKKNAIYVSLNEEVETEDTQEI